MAASAPLYLTDEFIKSNNLLQLAKLIPTIQNAMAAVSKSNSDVIQPPRTLMHVPSRKGVFLSMPAFCEYDDALACKLVTAYPNNVNKGLPSVIGTVLLFDSSTGKVLAIMDGTEITTWRTAAASVVATKHLHNGTKILAVLGSGTQARSHIEALDYYFNFEQIRVWNHRSEGAQKLTEELIGKGKTARAYESGEECVKDADVIVTATFASSPILMSQWVKPGAHINAVGAGVSHHSELDPELYRNVSIYTDTMAAAKVELKGLAEMGVTIKGEVGEIINGTTSVDRKEITVFQSLGMAVEDVVSAKLIYDEYKKIKK
ncbi:ketimine reductase mu-crystallin isoform X2 [Periplaneta americana]|uniref:ketimine reductase mu-crystallin isoform X2 n=1 Tax=Periplaneta americana TaxID=6978 RepID=UPI0037E876C4